MRILVAADIFGTTEPLRTIAAQCNEWGHQAEIIGPYADAAWFDDEGRAYGFFLGQGGVAAYADKVRGHLEGRADMPVCIGFSAGAAALWQVVAAAGEAVPLAVGFYGGQIRHAVTAAPRCPCLLIFPEDEPHFSVPGLISRLQGRPGVHCAAVPWRHGYMNRLSVNFDRGGYDRTMTWLEWLLNRPGRAGLGEDVFRDLLNTGS
ncbi:MAG: hypothetical protein ACWGKN_03470 [Desulfoprunum sp.]|jgi:dienelactone hydrolase